MTMILCFSQIFVAFANCFYFIIEDLSSLYSKDMNNSLMLKPQSRCLSLNPSHYTEKNSRTEDASRTRGGCFWHRISIRYTEACFLHRVPLKTRRVHQEPFSCTARPIRTLKVCFLHRIVFHSIHVFMVFLTWTR